jgi:uncharacterized protein
MERGVTSATSTRLDSQRIQHARALDLEIESLRNQLGSMPQVERVVLIGSAAAGRRDLFTDIDLVVVMRTELDFVSRLVELHRQLRATVALDLLVYTPEEFDNLRYRPFLRRALEKGCVLYEG